MVTPDLARMFALDLPESGINFEELMTGIERRLLERALAKSGGNKARAANMLHMKRTTLLAKFKSLAFRLELQSMQALLTVLANVARLGCAISQLTAIDSLVNLHIVAPTRLAHRVETCLTQIKRRCASGAFLLATGPGTRDAVTYKGCAFWTTCRSSIRNSTAPRWQTNSGAMAASRFSAC